MMNPPSHWRELPPTVLPGFAGVFFRAWQHALIPLRVLRSIATMRNGDTWVHISVTHKNRLPSWEELARIKSEFIGGDKEALHMIPKKDDHVNLHQRCMHLWSPQVVKTPALPNLQDLALEECL